MIRFNFTLNREEAECLLGAVQDKISDIKLRMLEETRPTYRDWYERHLRWIESIQDTIHTHYTKEENA